MLQVSDDEIMAQHKVFVSRFNDISKAPFMQDDFIRKAFPVLEKRVGRSYPYEVRIPKDINAMRGGDFEPAKIITVREPIKGPWSNIWFGDASSEIRFRTGYVNGDSRYISDQGFYKTYVHGLMGGATGQGKSVTLNEIIYGVCMEYAPWEVHVTLSDAKIVEFKSIALKHPMPNIMAVSATGDADYLISLLGNLCEEMQTMNSIFTTAGNVLGKDVKNVEDFRKVTGLTLPRNLIIFDEFQAMFMNAGKKAKDILAYINLFGRLGRNTGYHLLLTSQEIGDCLPKEVLNQISVRAAVGCSDDVSTMILGNPAAVKNKGKYGRLLFNLNHENGKAEDNVLIRVPLMSGSQTTEISDRTIDLGKEFGVTPILKFYDEEALYYEKDYYKFIDDLPYNEECIYLGEPAFVVDDPIQCLRLEFSSSEADNVFVVTPTSSNLERYFKMFAYNVKRNPNAQNIVICANNVFAEKCNAESLAPTKYFAEASYQNSVGFSIATSLVYRRILCLKVDEIVFNSKENCFTELSDTIFYSVFEKDSAEDTVVNRNRCYHIIGFLDTNDSIRKGLGIGDNISAAALLEKKKTTIRACIQMCAAYGCSKERLLIKNVPKIFVWILSIDRILGLGRDPNNRNIMSLKATMRDAINANIRFFIFGTTSDDITELRYAMRWLITDSIDSREISRLKLTDDYPTDVSGRLGVMYDSMHAGLGCRKFKKMFLDGELPPV